MEDRESMFLLSIGSCLFCFVLLFCIIGMFSLEQRSDRFACKPIIKDLIFLKLGVPSVVVQTPLYNAAPSCVELCFVSMVLGGRGQGKNNQCKHEAPAACRIVHNKVSYLWPRNLRFSARVHKTVAGNLLACKKSKSPTLIVLDNLVAGQSEALIAWAQGHADRKQQNWAWNWVSYFTFQAFGYASPASQQAAHG